MSTVRARGSAPWRLRIASVLWAATTWTCGANVHDPAVGYAMGPMAVDWEERYDFPGCAGSG